MNSTNSLHRSNSVWDHKRGPYTAMIPGFCPWVWTSQWLELGVCEPRVETAAKTNTMAITRSWFPSPGGFLLPELMHTCRMRDLTGSHYFLPTARCTHNKSWNKSFQGGGRTCPSPKPKETSNPTPHLESQDSAHEPLYLRPLPIPNHLSDVDSAT